MGSPTSKVPLTQPLSPDSQIGGRTLKAQPSSADTNYTWLNHHSASELSRQFWGRSFYRFPWAGKGMSDHWAPKQGSCPSNSHLSAILGFYSTKGYGSHSLLKSWSHLITEQLSLCSGRLGHCCGPAEKEVIWNSDPLHYLVPTQILDDLGISSTWQM